MENGALFPFVAGHDPLIQETKPLLQIWRATMGGGSQFDILLSMCLPYLAYLQK